VEPGSGTVRFDGRDIRSYDPRDLRRPAFMLAAGTATGSLFFVRLAAARYLTSAHQLRRYLL
jgi:pectin methylesterase-like acyl-CoA thioesterase